MGRLRTEGKPPSLSAMKIPLLLSSLVLAVSSPAAVIFQENFDGDNTTSLNGIAPDVRPGSEVWTSNATTVLRTDGSIATTGGASAWLPYTLASNQIYTLTAVVDLTYNAGSAAPIGVGFTSNAPLSGAAVNLADSGDYGILQARRDGTWAFFEGDDNNAAATASGSGLFTSSQDNYEIKLVLDTRAAAWTLAGYLNGIQVDLNGAGAGLLFTYASNPVLTGVGVSYASSTYVFENFALDAVPEPGGAVLATVGLGGLLFFRRRAKGNC